MQFISDVTYNYPVGSQGAGSGKPTGNAVDKAQTPDSQRDVVRDEGFDQALDVASGPNAQTARDNAAHLPEGTETAGATPNDTPLETGQVGHPTIHPLFLLDVESGAQTTLLNTQSTAGLEGPRIDSGGVFIGETLPAAFTSGQATGTDTSGVQEAIRRYGGSPGTLLDVLTEAASDSSDVAPSLSNQGNRGRTVAELTQSASVEGSDEALLRVQGNAAELSGDKPAVAASLVALSTVTGEVPQRPGTPTYQRPVGTYDLIEPSEVQPESSVDDSDAVLDAVDTLIDDHVMRLSGAPVAKTDAQQRITDSNGGGHSLGLDARKAQLESSTAFGELHDDAGEQPATPGKPLPITKPGVELFAQDLVDQEQTLHASLSQVERDGRAVSTDLTAKPSSLESTKTIGVTPIEPTHDARANTSAPRGPMTPIGDVSEGIHRVEQAIKLGPVTNPNTMRLHVDPPDLGRMIVNLSVQDSRVTTAMITEQPFVRDILLANQHRLESSLQDQGLRMQDFSVDLGRKGAYLGHEQAEERGHAAPRTLKQDTEIETTAGHREEDTPSPSGLNLFA